MDFAYFYSAKQGKKFFELSNHLENVLSVVSGRKLPVDDDLGAIAYYQPDVVSYSDYYPFGMQLDSLHASSGGYRYGVNGMEADDEVKGMVVYQIYCSYDLL